MRAIRSLILPVVLVSSNCFAQSLCVAPAQFSPKDGSARGLYCKAENFSLKIDDQVMAWSTTEYRRLTELDPSTSHKVIVLCDHKPQQSFTFRFSDFET